MPVMDEFKEERASLKNKSFKKKLEYFWGYYKWYVIGGIIGLTAVAGIVVSILNRKEDALYGVAVNGIATKNEEAFWEGFAEYAGIEFTQYNFDLNSDLRMSGDLTEETVSTTEFIMVYTAGKDLDIGLMDEERFFSYAYNYMFADLSECLDADTFAALSSQGRIFYMDRAVAGLLQELRDSYQSTDDVIMPDPFLPQDMEEPVPVGVLADDCESLLDAYYYASRPVYIGIINNSLRKDTAAGFITYVTKDLR